MCLFASCWLPPPAPIVLFAARPATNMAVRSETTAPTADALAGFELFRDLPSDQLAALSPRCQWRRYRAHQIILGYRDDSRDVFFIVRGQVRVTFFSESGREVSFRDLPAGEMFGELSAIDSLPRSCTVVALTHTMVAVMSASLLWDLLCKHESVITGVLQRLTRLVPALSERVVPWPPLVLMPAITLGMVLQPATDELGGPLGETVFLHQIVGGVPWVSPRRNASRSHDSATPARALA